MRRLAPAISFTLLMLMFAVFASAQDCKERGHVMGGPAYSTLMYCPPYLLETKDTTWMVYPSCNSMRGTCLRCNQLFSQSEPERREVIWTQPKPSQKPKWGFYFKRDSLIHLYTYSVDSNGVREDKLIR